MFLTDNSIQTAKTLEAFGEEKKIAEHALEEVRAEKADLTDKLKEAEDRLEELEVR